MSARARWVVAVGLVAACATPATLPPAQWRARIREAMGQQVQTREQRDEYSRMLAQAVEEGALDDLNRHQVRAAFGPGQSCGHYPICGELGFAADDWHYSIGQMGDEKTVKVLPVLLLGFDSKGRVARVWTRTTH